MDTFLDIQNWVLSKIDDTSDAMRTKVKEDINTILQPEYLGVKYPWNLNATTWAIASGASTVALPSLMAGYNKRTFFNLSYSNPMQPADYRIFKTRKDNGVVEHYWRMGNNFVFNAANAAQNLYFEWWPHFASLVASSDVPLCPNRQVIAEGALWLLYDRTEKWKKAERQMQKFYAMKAALDEESEEPFLSFEDPDQIISEG